MLRLLESRHRRSAEPRSLVEEMLLFADGQCQLDSEQLRHPESGRPFTIHVSASGARVAVACRAAPRAGASAVDERTPVGTQTISTPYPSTLDVLPPASAGEKLVTTFQTGNAPTAFADAVRTLVVDFRARFWHACDRAVAPVLADSLVEKTSLIHTAGPLPAARWPRAEMLSDEVARDAWIWRDNKSGSTSIRSTDGFCIVTLSGNRQRWRVRHPCLVSGDDGGSALVESEGSIQRVPPYWKHPLALLLHALGIPPVQVPAALQTTWDALDTKGDGFVVGRYPEAPPNVCRAGHALNTTQFAVPNAPGVCGDGAETPHKRSCPVSALQHVYRRSNGGRECISVLVLAPETAEAEAVYTLATSSDAAGVSLLARTEQHGAFLRIWPTLTAPETESPSILMPMAHLPSRYHHPSVDGATFDLAHLCALLVDILHAHRQFRVDAAVPTRVPEAAEVARVRVPETGEFAAYADGLVTVNFGDRTMLEWRLDPARVADGARAAGGTCVVVNPRGATSEWHFGTRLPLPPAQWRPYVFEALRFAAWAFG